MRSTKVFFLIFYLQEFLTLFLCKADSICNLDRNNICVFKNVTTSDSKLLFYPIADKPNAVKVIKIQNSTIKTLTNEICKAFPSSELFFLEGISMKNIQNGALDQCKKLTVVSFKKMT